MSDKCAESGHLGVAQRQIGKVLIHSPCDPDGLWIHRAIANALDNEDAEKMRDGYCMGLLASRGAYMVDPTGKPEKELAKEYRMKAGEIEVRYDRLSTTLREFADDYDREAYRVIDRYGEHSEE